MSDSLTARSMLFASCNPTNPRANLWNFHEKILRIGDFEKWPFLKNGHFGFFFKKRFFFCFILMKISPNFHGRMDGLKFWCFLEFPENSLVCVILRYTVYLFSMFVDQETCKLYWYTMLSFTDYRLQLMKSPSLHGRSLFC